MKKALWQDDHMVHRTLLVVVWFQTAILFLLLTLTYLSALRAGSQANTPYRIPFSDATLRIQTPLSTGKVLGTSVESADARAMLLSDFIKKYQPNSPFLAYTDLFIIVADRYQIDFRLVPAIAMCESNLGKRVPTKDSYNAWGIAVYTNSNKGKKFESWEHAIEWVSKYIREKFYDKGVTDLREIGAIWAPPSVDNDYSWTRCVESFMDRMK